MLKKKAIIIIMTMMLALTSMVNADVATIKDIDTSSAYAKAAIQYLAEQNVISGDQNGNFIPQKSVTRAEMVALMAKALNLDLADVPATATFKDVPTNNWAFKYVEAAYREGIVSGISTTEFRPNDKITREQMAIIFVKALKLVDKDTQIEYSNINSYADKTKISSWAQKEVEVAMEAGLMTGVSSNSFEPKTAANKESTAVVIERIMKNKEAITSRFSLQNGGADINIALDKLVNTGFIGDMKAQGEVKLSNNVTKKFTKLFFEMLDRQNDDYTIASYAKETIEATGKAPEVDEYQSIVMNNKIYLKDFSDNKWIQKNLSNGFTYAYAPFYDPIFENEEIQNVEMNEILLDNISRIDVKNEGIVYISGIPTTKYVMQFDINTIQNTMPADEYEAVKEFADSAFQGKLNYRYEFYVANNTVIKQTYEFDGNTIDSVTGNSINYHSYTTIYYKNIGKKSVITAPAASQIKQVIQ